MKLKPAATDTVSLLREVCGEDGSRLKHCHKMTSWDASMARRSYVVVYSFIWKLL